MSIHVTRRAEDPTLEPFKAETLPSNGRPIAALVRFRGNVFTESLPSNGHIRHHILFPFCWFVNYVVGTSDSVASEAAVAYCKVLYPHFPERTKKNHEIFSVRIDEIGTRHHSNTSQKYYRLSHFAR
jgi:hypothetical protein